MPITPSRVPLAFQVSAPLSAVLMMASAEWATVAGVVLFGGVAVPSLLFAWGAERGQTRTRETEVAHYARQAQALYRENVDLTQKLREHEQAMIQRETQVAGARVRRGRRRR